MNRVVTKMAPATGAQPRTMRYTGIDREVTRWYAVRTCFRHEKMALKDLTRQGVEAWLPLLKETRRHHRKMREVEIPLLGSYIFVHINEKGYLPVISSPYVNGFIRFGDHIVPVPDEEMELLHRIVGAAEIIDARQRVMEPGDMVEIIGGKLTGVRGVIEEQRGNHEVSVSLITIGYTLVLQVDPKFLRKI